MNKMSIINANTVNGTRDFLPLDNKKRKFIFNIMRSVFEKYGFQEIETPALENIETLTGKYGEEGDALLFKVLNSGNYLKKIDLNIINKENISAFTSLIIEKGLRYDLTIPLARFVAKHQNEIVFPFKRYHIAPVWRADRPQRGRYREFYQCDCDVVGSNSLLCEVELIQIYNEVLDKLNIEHEILINNRKILQGVIDSYGLGKYFDKIVVIIDKWDKIGKEKVFKELEDLGIIQEKVKSLLELFEINDYNLLKNMVNNEVLNNGVEELNYIFKMVNKFNDNLKLTFDIKLARGLNYYTGSILEVKALNVDMGSIGGAGRYDNLTEIFGLKAMSGVGCSFGAERIFDIMEQKKLFPNEILESNTKCMFVNFSEQCEEYTFKALQKLRNENINAEIYPHSAKIQKQMKYADAKNIPFVIIAGEEEMKNNVFTLKNMKSGEQLQLSISEITQKIKE